MLAANILNYLISSSFRIFNFTANEYLIKMSYSIFQHGQKLCKHIILSVHVSAIFVILSLNNLIARVQHASNLVAIGDNNRALHVQLVNITVVQVNTICRYENKDEKCNKAIFSFVSLLPITITLIE